MISILASRTLSPAEKGYSQLEKEGLACVYGVKKFHEYLFGRMFFLYTDHKPLLGLLDEQKPIPAQASVRIQRWALTLEMYQYHLKLKSSDKNADADALSRLPLTADHPPTPLPAELVLMMEALDEDMHSRLEGGLKEIQRYPESCSSKGMAVYCVR